MWLPVMDLSQKQCCQARFSTDRRILRFRIEGEVSNGPQRRSKKYINANIPKADEASYLGHFPYLNIAKTANPECLDESQQRTSRGKTRKMWVQAFVAGFSDMRMKN